MLRRIGELYSLIAESDDDPDEFFASNEWRSWAFVPRLLRVLESRERTDVDESRPSAGLRNSRCSAWEQFLEFMMIQDNWTTKPPWLISRSALADELLAMRVLFKDLRMPQPHSDNHLPLTKLELEAIEGVLSSHRPDYPFHDSARERNLLIYSLLRWGGLRMGEALNITYDDLPATETPSARIIRELSEECRSISVTRRPDDPLDSRIREARVKRRNHAVWFPDDVLSGIENFVNTVRSRGSKSRYIIQTTDKSLAPLSQSRAEKIVKTLGGAAAREFERRNPELPHTLLSLCAHRFRATRATELMEVFFPDPTRQTDAQKEEFCEFFGWTTFDSAAPYISMLRKREGQRLFEAGHKQRIEMLKAAGAL